VFEEGGEAGEVEAVVKKAKVRCPYILGLSLLLGIMSVVKMVVVLADP